MKKIPENKQESERAERRQGASLLLADAVLLALGGQINAEHTLRDLAINGNDVMAMGFRGKTDRPGITVLPGCRFGRKNTE